MTRHTSSNPPGGDSHDAYDLSRIFIGREQQLDLFDIYLTRWQHLLFNANPDLDPPVLTPPSPNNKLQGLVVLLYGRGGFGKSTLLARYRNIALQESRHLTVSAIVDWEFAVEGKRGLFNPPPGQEIDPAEYFRVLCAQLAIALDKAPNAFKAYQTAVKAVDDARKKANGILDSLRQDDRYGWLRGLTVDAITTAIRTYIPGSSTILDNPSVKSATAEAAKLTQEQIAHLRTRLHDRLGSTVGDYLDPALRLGLAVGRDLHDLARNFPLLIYFDTYEEIDEADQLLRIVMAAAGLRVGWLLVGRDNLWAGPGQRERSTEMEYGYKDLVPADRGLSINFNAGDIGAFTISEITEYFALLRKQVRQELSLPTVTGEDATRIFDVTQGIPLAVKIAAGLYLETATLETITAAVEGKREIVDGMVRRYLLHTRTDQSEKVKLYGLALLRRADQPAAVAAALSLTPEQAQTSYEQELSRLHRRYSFIFTEKDQPTLHQEVRHFLRLWLLERRKDPEIIAVNQRLKDAHETVLKTLEEHRQYDSLQERLQDDDWVGTYLDLAEQQCWLDPVEGVRSLLPFMLAAAIYRRDINKDAAAVGQFFATDIRSPYRTQWEWAAQSLIYNHSRDPSAEELTGLTELAKLVRERCPSFPRPLPDFRQELEAALWWRLGEAYIGKDDSQALAWYEQALERLKTQRALQEAAAGAAWNVANKLYEEKKHAECIPFLNRAIELHSDYVFAFTSRGIAYWYLKQYERAIADYDRAIELDPKYALAYYNRGIAYSDLKQYERAIADYNRAIELDPNYVFAYFNRGNAYRNLKQYERAIADYDRANALDPNDAEAYNNRGNAYYDLKQYERAIVDYDRAIELDPKYALAYNNRGSAYWYQKRYERATADYDRAIELDPKYALAYNNRGLAYWYQKQYERAIADYDRAIELDPNYALAYYNRGLAYWYQKRYERAIADYDRAIALDPNDAVAYNNRGLAYYNQKQYEQAIADYDRAIELDPNYAAACNNRGVSYENLGQYDKAIVDYDRAIKLDPNYATAYRNRGDAYRKLHQYTQAIADYDRAIALDPSYARAYSNRGLASLWIHNTQQAHADYSRSYELDPTDVNAAWMAEWTALGKQRADIETAARLEQIATIDPQHYLFYVCHGVALGLRGQLKAGLAALEQAIPLEPEEWDAYFWKGMLSAYYRQTRSQEAITLAAIEQSLQLGLPPVLLTPLYWLAQDRPSFFTTHIKPLLDSHGL
jgi:tetratricopeptide (TPR) repeat protein